MVVKEFGDRHGAPSFVLPLYLSQQQGYNAEQIGEVLA
jgi:hypothetical protein